MSSDWAVREMTSLPKPAPLFLFCRDWKWCDRLVWSRLCIFLKSAPPGHRLRLYLPPFTSPSCIHFSPPISLFFSSVWKRGCAGAGGVSCRLIQLGSVIGWLAFRGVTERLKNSVAQTWLWLCSIWSQVWFVTAKQSPSAPQHPDHRPGPARPILAQPSPCVWFAIQVLAKDAG